MRNFLKKCCKMSNAPHQPCFPPPSHLTLIGALLRGRINFLFTVSNLKFATPPLPLPGKKWYVTYYTCLLKQKTSSRNFCCWLCIQIRVRLDSPLMNWTSTCEYLEVSNIFVWYKTSGSVCWISRELNLFMNVFITFAIRS